MGRLTRTAKKSALILAIAAMVPYAGPADGADGGGKPKGPPQEAVAACAGLNEGDTVQFTSPRGETVSGICREIRGGLVAVPEGGFPGRRGKRGPGGWHFDRMTKKLDLTEAQQEQIRAILKTEREKAAPLRRKLAENRMNLRKIIEAEPFDEAAVRALAERRNETRVELVVSRARAKNRIHALLSPEQREAAKTLCPKGKGRHGRRTWR